ncbi:DNA-3-methyladenine glycosylase [Glycomyces sp. TRM65418]|uniref:DNA-3-methyladenine glycosylase n=1 Tax=Glycomyces sp. TRM65418 TaxID=2867006 RepID=UPI001CE5E26F|nr:DNA-3-methyladenine glycosylase [Glycomyces sp. TRM65418]MCC3764957.1 DNA-3-methyladenine glycosylase [Glycomyces sp. TRM65418]QZD54595.1 DNA-3-methyladenine glycosylase [Glycomyces sp. TRM65418]
MSTPLDRSFFERDSVTVAPELLGCAVSANGVTVRLTEVEAYRQDDPASHTFRGPTKRTAVMFGPAGHLYVYFTYGMHYCGNLVCGPEGFGAGVLLRAGEVVDGLDAARERRGPRATDRDLARGPARLAQALGWGRDDNGRDMIGAVYASAEPAAVLAGPRTGITKAADAAWRFWIPGDRFVSPYKRHPKAPAAEAEDREPGR